MPVAKDGVREKRLWMEIMVDAYGPEEQAMSWYYYLEDYLPVPFDARCFREDALSPLVVNETVTVEELAAAEVCERNMFVTIKWHGRRFAVPLSQLQPVDVNPKAEEVIADWHYWVDRGYEF